MSTCVLVETQEEKKKLGRPSLPKSTTLQSCCLLLLTVLFKLDGAYYPYI